MKIGIFTDRYLPQTDGISVSVETFRIKLEKLGHEVYVFAPKPSLLRYEEPSDHIIRFPAIKGLFFEDNLTSFFFPPQVMHRIDKLNLDIIHFQTPGQIGLMGMYYAIQKKISLVTTYHTDYYEYVKHYRSVLPGAIILSLLTPVLAKGTLEEFRQTFTTIRPERSIDEWNQKMLVRSLTLLHNRCDLIITPSIKFEKQLKKWRTEAKIFTLPTGVDKIPATETTAAVRNRYSFQPTDKIILLVCRIGTEKNVGLLISAFDTIGKHLPDAKLLIVGPGDDLDYFKKQAATSNYPERITFTGFIAYRDLGAYYDAADLFAFPSLTDTQGLTVNEAACAGLPIVMIDRQITQVVQDGENGYYARNTAKDFATKIMAILTNSKLSSRMSKRSVELAADFSASKQAVKLQDLYREVIEHHDRPVS